MNKNEFFRDIVESLLKNLDVTDASVEVKSGEKDTEVIINIEGDDLGNLIGYHGETIVAFQNILLISYLRKFEDEINLFFDVNGYRKEREEKLLDSARAAANRVKKLSKPYKFSPMKAVDRRVIHMEISENYPELVSYSIGEGRDRRVVISKSELN